MRRLSRRGSPTGGVLCFLPRMRLLHQACKVGCMLVVGREEVVHVFLIAVVVQLSALLDLSGHLGLHLFNVGPTAVGVFEGFPGIEEGDPLDLGVSSSPMAQHKGSILPLP